MKAKEWLQIVPERIKALWGNEKSRTNLLLVAGLSGMLILAVGEWLPQPQPDQKEVSTVQSEPEYCALLEERLQNLIAQVEGAGKTQVMVTLETGKETQYATDTMIQSDGTMQSEHVLLGNSGALVQTVAAPKIQGVAVVCRGGGDAGVQYQITQLVQSLTGVGASHITVTKMCDK